MPKANHSGATNAWEELEAEAASVVQSVITPRVVEDAKATVKRAYNRKPKPVPVEESASMSDKFEGPEAV